MPISSFYGLQTSLRGLLAQQRLLDTTGHNIANASTQGYSRQEAALVASPALEIPAGGIAGGAGAHLGSGVDVQAFRRVRDQFIDLQYRGQNTNLGQWKARAAALDQAEGALAEPGENGINELLNKFWDSWSDLAGANGNDVGAAKQAVVESGVALADAFRTVRAQIAQVQSQTYAEYSELARPAGPGDPRRDVGGPAGRRRLGARRPARRSARRVQAWRHARRLPRDARHDRRQPRLHRQRRARQLILRRRRGPDGRHDRRRRRPARRP